MRDVLARATLGLMLGVAFAGPGRADPSPSPSPTATASGPSTAQSPAADAPIVETSAVAVPATDTPTPLASASAPASTSGPLPAPSGSYKEDLKMAALATSLLLQAQAGDVDRSMLESKMNLALSPSMVQSVSAQLAPLGKPKSITLVSRSVHGEFVAYKFRIVWESVAADESFALNPDGKIVAWGFAPVE